MEEIRTLNVNKRENEILRKDIAITHLQSASVLTPINRINTVRVTNLGGISGAKVVAGREVRVATVTKEEHEREVKSVVQMREIATVRRDTEIKMLHQGGVPVLHTDPIKSVKIDLPKPLPVVRPVEKVEKVVPARIIPPMHEERVIPKFEPPRPPEPPRKK
jgi:hypothetical protein